MENQRMSISNRIFEMAVDTNKVMFLRDACFALSSDKINANTPTFDEFKKLMSSFYKEIEEMDEVEQNEISYYITHSVPESEYEGAVNYLKQIVVPDSLRELNEIHVNNQKNHVKTDIGYPAQLQVRNLLRKGGYTWSPRYLDNLCQDLLIEAAQKFVSEKHDK